MYTRSASSSSGGSSGSSGGSSGGSSLFSFTSLLQALVRRQAGHHATIIHLGCIQEDHAANATVETKVMVGIFKSLQLGP